MLKKHGRITITLILITIIIILSISNIIWLNKYKELDKEELEVIKYCPKEDSEYNETKKYYNEINYKTLKKLLKTKSTIVLGVVDKNTSTSNKFRELINRYSYKNNKNLYLLDTSKLSKKNLISFYDLDDRLSILESNYIVIIKNKKIISITSFDTENINDIIESIGG